MPDQTFTHQDFVVSRDRSLDFNDAEALAQHREPLSRSFLSIHSEAALDLPQSSIHVDLDPGDVRGVLGRKKSHGAGNLLGLSKPLHW
jgi:hypothetical protein